MNKESLKASVDAVTEELRKCEEAGFVASAPGTSDLRNLVDAFNAQQKDLEQLVGQYVANIKASTDLVFWAKVLVSCARTATKGRSFVSTGAANGLAEALRNLDEATKNELDKPVQ